MIVPAALAAVSLGKGVYNYIQGRNNLPKKFKNTHTGKRLKKVSQEGIYSPTTRRTIMGRAGAQAGHVMSRARGDEIGRQRRGFGGTTGFNRGYNTAVQNKMEIMGDTAADIEMQNEQAKQQALERYVQGRDRTAQLRKQGKREAQDALWGGVFDAATTMIPEIPGMMGAGETNLPDGFETMAPDAIWEYSKNSGQDYEQLLNLQEDMRLQLMRSQKQKKPARKSTNEIPFDRPDVPIVGRRYY